MKKVKSPRSELLFKDWIVADFDLVVINPMGMCAVSPGPARGSNFAAFIRLA